MFLTLAVPYFVRVWEERRDVLPLTLAIATVALLLLKWQTHYGFDYRPDEVLPLLAELVAFALYVVYTAGVFSLVIGILRPWRGDWLGATRLGRTGGQATVRGQSPER
ncbi:MAG: hypothetical protein JO090_12790 [Rhizobacter sp.]|nr:hypothetical protein [Rhizobacter sp.]